MTSKNSARSRTLRAIGPSTASVWNGSWFGPDGTRPGEGRRPTTPQNDAGVRNEPPRSEPVASQAWPVANATAEPPELPPQVRPVSHGLDVVPWTSLKVTAPAPNSGVLVLPSTIPPAASIRSTDQSDVSGTWSRKIVDP